MNYVHARLHPTAWARRSLIGPLPTALIAGSALTAWLAGQWRTELTAPRLVCLMYHRFVTPQEYARLSGSERIYSISIDRFESQLRFLRRAGYRSVGLDEALAFLRGRRQASGPEVLVTIDDGCRSVLTFARPLLKKHGFRATLFITTDPRAYVFHPVEPGRARLTDDEIRALDPSVFDVQSHAVTHCDLRNLPNAQLRAELCDSRNTLQRLVGRPVRCLAVPGNWYDRRVLLFARRAGYEAVFVSDPGTNQPGCDLLRLRRLTVAGSLGESAFAELVSPRGAARRRLAHALRHMLR
jgi:peptidoglycan/xylan/chitin deacetylase (PgdA/CDA1 family)